jgi:hypothetical protein
MLQNSPEVMTSTTAVCTAMKYHLSAADLLLRLFLGIPPVLKKVPGPPFMRDVEKRVTHD